MVPGVFNLALGSSYLLLLGLIGIQYRRGRIVSRQLPMLLGMCATWLSYSLLQVTQGGPVPTGTPLNYVLDGVAIVLLVAGSGGLYWWWRHRGHEDTGSSPTD
ncbi:hypothetical protein [Haloarcula japonica]|uniref:Uncharacterized protein n=1 Tax=Haloarcula japonica (strain ATCC 49778 / DSM 6131 / JCM 7785 / NBRC 101032 / NCIMB 13157 / TR-1) TaxID=1227453 RepID=M0L0K7_HALJT|nr:hypothetical protein C444_20981 [Haloarcula japonica DSM 6131]